MKPLRAVLLFILTLSLCVSFSGCGENKDIKEMETYIFSYGCNTENIGHLKQLKDSSSFAKWIENVAIEIGSGKYSELQVSALMSNLDRAKIRNAGILEQAIVFYKADQYSEGIKSENIIDILIELDKNGYHGYSPDDYYNIYANSLTAEQVRASAQAQLETCSIDSGYYDNYENRQEKEPADDGALLKWEWTYTYMGDFCIEEKRTYHYLYGNEISGSDGNKREGTVFYRGEDIPLRAESLRNALEIYRQADGNAYIIYTKDGKIETNVGVHIPQFS